MVDKDLLTAKGTIEGVLFLASEEESVNELSTVADDMGVATSTARERLESLEEEGLVKQSAELINENPTRVFNLTEEGEELADNLEQILD